jgi:hypothetical protein
VEPAAAAVKTDALENAAESPSLLRLLANANSRVAVVGESLRFAAAATAVCAAACVRVAMRREDEAAVTREADAAAGACMQRRSCAQVDWRRREGTRSLLCHIQRTS